MAKWFLCCAAAAGSFFAAQPVHAAEVLIQYSFNAGFSPRPGTESVTVTSDGRVVFHSRYMDGGSGQVEETEFLVATLDVERVKALKSLLPALKNQDLKDEQEGKPLCTDAPSTVITVPWAGNTVTLFRKASCHTWVNDTSAAVQIRAAMEGLAAISRM